jgi:hypothetical protein
MLSKAKLAKFLSSCVIDPRSPGPFASALKIGNLNFLEMKAVELVHEARAFPLDNERYLENIRKAITLLAYAGAESEAILDEAAKARRKNSDGDTGEAAQA